MLSDLLHRVSSKIAAPDLMTRERPAIPSGKSGLEPTANQHQDILDEYAQLSKSLGIENPHIGSNLMVEKFKAFLRKKDWAIFSLPTVVSYMDQKSAAESDAKSGWHWRPLRAKDDIKNVKFGTQATAWQTQNGIGRNPASDYYHGPHSETQEVFLGGGNINQIFHQGIGEVRSSGMPYDKLIPIHALRKVAETESEFHEPVSFFVCDYAPAPHIEYPDPFLMAVINNANLNRGVGRFVIDFWDEPGFGLESQLA